MVKTRYGYDIPDDWIQCRGCPDIVNKDIADIYTYGFCTHCQRKVPEHIPSEQMRNWLNGHYKTKVY
jgi:hypothetical protein